MLSTIQLIGLSVLLAGSAGAAQDQPASKDAGFAVEYYYKVRWGHFDEWLELYKKNHWPLLKEGLRDGSMLAVEVERPFHHAGEANRWDIRVTIVYRDIRAAHGLDDAETEPLIKKLFPDQKRFEEEERRRFELLDEHLDVPIYMVDVSRW